MMAAASTSNKVKGLTLITREQYLSKFVDVLHENYTGCVEESDRIFDKKDIEDCAVDMEYQLFSSNTTMMMYRNNMAKTVSFFFKLVNFNKSLLATLFLIS